MSEAAKVPSVQLNTRGLRCPEPVMMLHQAIRKAKAGDIVEVLATDPSTSWDIPKFCMHLGHELLLKEESLDENSNTEYRYLAVIFHHETFQSSDLTNNPHSHNDHHPAQLTQVTSQNRLLQTQFHYLK